MSSILYFIAQIFVGWIWKPPYSLWTNTISDLGNTACRAYGGSYVCSPRHDWMNAAFIFVGAVMAGGSLLVYQEFNHRREGSAERPWSRGEIATLLGFVALAVGGLGAILVGLFPENVNGAMHATGAALAIGVGDLGMVMLGISLGSQLPPRLRRFMIGWGTVSLVAGLMFVFHRHFGLGTGGLERIAAYPETIWLISFGMWITGDHLGRQRSPGPPANAAR